MCIRDRVSTNLGDDETFRVAINDLKAIVDREFDRKNEVDVYKRQREYLVERFRRFNGIVKK